MEPDTTKTPVTAEHVHAVGGDVRSNSDTIHALRQGVDLTQRTGAMVVDDHLGHQHELPVTLNDGEHGPTVVLRTDLLGEADKRAAGPRRRTGTVELESIESLIAYIKRYKGEDTVAFAPVKTAGITAVFDYHPSGPDAARWREDRASYRCAFSRQWLFWTDAEKKVYGQVAFGDLLEANEVDLTTRDGFASSTTMLEVARNLSIISKGTYKRTHDPVSGQYTFTASDEHAEQSTKIPKGFALAIPVFEGDDALYPVEALMRFSMGAEGKSPQFGFILQNRDKVLEHALGALRARVAAECAIPVFVGTAPQAAR